MLETGNNPIKFLIHVKRLAEVNGEHVIEKKVEELLDDSSPNKLFSIALYGQDPTMMELAIKKGATNVNIGHNAAVQWAAANNKLSILKILLKNPLVDPGDNTVDGARYSRDERNDAIRRAAQNGHVEAVKLLMKHPKVDPSAKNNFALRHSLKMGHYKVSELLLNDKRVRESIAKEDLIKLMKKLFQDR